MGNFFWMNNHNAQFEITTSLNSWTPPATQFLLLFLGRKWANALFVQKNQRFVPFSKLIREMPLKYELIKLKKKKKKKLHGTRVHGARVPLKCHYRPP